MKHLPCLEDDVIYKDRLDWTLLECEDIVFTYKVILGLVSDSCNELFMMSNSSISTRGHDYKLFPLINSVNISSPSESLNRETVCLLITAFLKA